MEWTFGSPPARLVGALVPSSNTVVEPGFMRLAANDTDAPVFLHSRLRVTSIDPGSNSQFAVQPMVEAASLLADAAPTGIVWAGTSGGWNGLDADHRIVEAIEAATGIATTTTTLATVAAVRDNGIAALGFATPYVDAVCAGIEATYGGLAGVDRVLVEGLGITDNASFARIPAEVFADQVRSLAARGCEAVAVYCTNVGFASHIAALEDELGIGIIDSVAVSYWAASQIVGAPSSAPLGRLFSTTPKEE